MDTWLGSLSERARGLSPEPRALLRPWLLRQLPPCCIHSALLHFKRFLTNWNARGWQDGEKAAVHVTYEWVQRMKGLYLS